MISGMSNASASIGQRLRTCRLTLAVPLANAGASVGRCLRRRLGARVLPPQSVSPAALPEARRSGILSWLLSLRAAKSYLSPPPMRGRCPKGRGGVFYTTLFALHFRPFLRPHVCAYILYMYVYIILYISLWESMNKSVARKGLPPLYLEKNEDVRALNGV